MKFGTSSLSKLYYGSSAASAAYLGSSLVWSSGVEAYLALPLSSNYTNASSSGITVGTLGGTPTFSSGGLSLDNGWAGNESNVIPSLASNDYTIEFRLFRNGYTGSYEPLIHLPAGSTGSSGINIHLFEANEIQFNDGVTGAAYGGDLEAGQWYHVACVSASNEKRIYLDGVEVGYETQSTPAGPYAVYIGYTRGLAYTTDLIIKDVRITPAALYCGTFTPPSSPISAIATPQSCP
jgi:hypothetical protein